MKLAIVGAGAAGLAAAHRLRRERPALEIVVFERGREVGGRAASRRLRGAIFDHGAQYLKAPTPDLERLVAETLAHETLVDIALPVWCFDGDDRITAGDPPQNADSKWTYTDGLSRLSRELARGLDVRFGARVARFEADIEAYRLLDDRGRELARVEAVLLTPPAPETAALVAASDGVLPEQRSRLLAELGSVPYRRCLSITLGYPPILKPRPWYALVNVDRCHPLSWLAYEHLKPGRASGDGHVVIAQMAPGWSSEHWDDPPDVTAGQVGELLSKLLGEDLRAPVWSDHAAWPHALPDGRADFELLNGAAPGLFFAGDFTAGQGRIHFAIEQGWRVAERIAACAQRGALD